VRILTAALVLGVLSAGCGGGNDLPGVGTQKPGASKPVSEATAKNPKGGPEAKGAAATSPAD